MCSNHFCPSLKHGNVMFVAAWITISGSTMRHKRSITTASFGARSSTLSYGMCFGVLDLVQDLFGNVHCPRSCRFGNVCGARELVLATCVVSKSLSLQLAPCQKRLPWQFWCQQKTLSLLNFLVTARLVAASCLVPNTACPGSCVNVEKPCLGIILC